MNVEAARQGRPDTNTIPRRNTSNPGGGNTLAIVAALDELEAGNVEGATRILSAALEDGPSHGRCCCRVCGLDLAWPGRREEHERRVHGVLAA